jgi:hypothetical protein
MRWYVRTLRFRLAVVGYPSSITWSSVVRGISRHRAWPCQVIPVMWCLTAEPCRVDGSCIRACDLGWTRQSR